MKPHSVQRHLRLLGLAWLATAVWSDGAIAGVLEIRPDGTVATYEGAAVYSDTGAAAIRLATAAARAPTQPDVTRAIRAAALYHGISPDLIEAVAWQESRFRQTATSSVGAVGVMQLMPGTARDLGVDRHDLTQNVYGGVAYLRQMLLRYGGDLTLALAAYNAGPGAVDRHRGVPPFAETQAYVAAILSRLAQTADQPPVYPVLTGR